MNKIGIEIGSKVIVFNTIDSTQKEAKRRIKNNEQNGTIIWAKEQSSGCGTHGRKWYSGKETNIAFTVILYPNCDIKNLENITIVIANSIVKTIRELYGYELEIKKPNDLMLNGKKIGGILTEITTRGEVVETLLIGIGLNVNQKKMPEELQDIATSLAIEYNKKFKIEEIGKKIILNLKKIF